MNRLMRAWFLFEGRIDRVGFLLRWILSFAFLVLPSQVMRPSAYDAWYGPWLSAVLLGGLVCFLWVFMGLQIRRLHDLSLHGLWIVVPWLIVLLFSWLGRAHGLLAGHKIWLPFVLLPFFLFLMLAPGEHESNGFGASPSMCARKANATRKQRS